MTNKDWRMHAERKLLLSTRIPVRWGDMDAYGHLNNTLYFRFFEQERVEWIEQLGFPVRSESESGPVIVHTDCTFLIPVNYPSTAEVRMYGGQPGRSSLMSWYELYVEGDERLYAEGSAKVVWMNVESGKSVPLPDAVRTLF
jgi:acyl-CoA thioester hydrolase